MAAISGNVTHYNAHVVADQGCAGLDAETLLRVIGAVVLAVAAIFIAIGCCLGLCEDDDRLAHRDVRHLNPGREAPQLQVRVGKVNQATGVTEAAEVATKDLMINPGTLGVAPKPIGQLLHELNRNNNVDAIPIDELLNWVDALFAKGTDEHTTVHHYIGEYIKFIRERPNRETPPLLPGDAGYENDIWDPYFAELLLLAKNIVFELRNPDAPIHKKRDALMEIADAKQHCRPRIREESVRQFLTLSGRLSMGDKLSQWAQKTKEGIIYEVFTQGAERNRQFHVINQARRDVGVEWGLDRDPSNLSDPLINVDNKKLGVITPDQFRQALQIRYTPARLVETIRTLMVYDGDLRTANEYLFEQAQGHPELAELAVFEAVEAGSNNDPSKRKEYYNVITPLGVAKFCELAGLLVKK